MPSLDRSAGLLKVDSVSSYSPVDLKIGFA